MVDLGTKDVAVLTHPGTPGVQVDNSDTLMVLTKIDENSFQTSNLHDQWSLFVTGDADENTGPGFIDFDAAGDINGGTIHSLGGDSLITSGTYTINSAGSVFATVNVTDHNGDSSTLHFTGQLNDGQDVLSLSNTSLQDADNNGTPRMLEAVRNGEAYTLADLNGTWFYASDGLTGTLTFNGKGGVTGSGLDDDGDPFSIKGKYSIVTSGKAGAVTITATGFPTADGPKKSTIFPSAAQYQQKCAGICRSAF